VDLANSPPHILINESIAACEKCIFRTEGPLGLNVPEQDNQSENSRLERRGMYRIARWCAVSDSSPVFPDNGWARFVRFDLQRCSDSEVFRSRPSAQYLGMKIAENARESIGKGVFRPVFLKGGQP
jgi:hypothetical protein